MTENPNPFQILRHPTSRPSVWARVSLTYYSIRCLHTLAHAGYFAVFVTYLSRILPNAADAALCSLFVIGAGLLFESAFEVLTGVVADRFGRSKSVFLYAVCYLSAALLFALPSTLPTTTPWDLRGVLTVFLIGQLFFDLGGAFLSGSLESWAVDYLRATGHKPDVRTLFPSAATLQNIMWLVGGTIALALLTRFGAPVPWLFIVGLMIVVALVAVLLMPEPYLGSPEFVASSRLTLVQFAKRAFLESLRHKELRKLSFAFAGGYALWISVAYLWVPVYAELARAASQRPDIPALPTEIAFAIFGVARIAGSVAAQVLAHRNRTLRQPLLWATAINSLPICLLLLVSIRLLPITPHVFLALMCFSKIGEEIVKPLRLALVNEHISNDSMRASIISSGFFWGGLTSAVLGLALLWLTRETGPNTAPFPLLLGAAAALSAAIALPAYYLLSKGDASK